MNIRPKIGIGIGLGFVFAAIATTGPLHGQFSGCNGNRCVTLPDYQTEAIGSTEGLEYKPGWALSKVPAALFAAIAFGYSWYQAEQLKLEREREAIKHAADLEAFESVAQMHAAERYYDEFAPYLEVDAAEVPTNAAPPNGAQNLAAAASAEGMQNRSLHSPAVATAQAPNPRRDGLIRQLERDCPLLLKLVKSHPIRAVGVQRTGKTTLVKKLCLLRMVLLPGHQVIASTPHYEPENTYPSVFKVVGNNGKRDYPAIEAQWVAMAQRIENCERNSISTIWDEFGAMDEAIEPEKLMANLKSSLREAMKHGEQPIFVAHGETKAFLPGTDGLVKVLLASTVRVETIGQLVKGLDGLDEMQPTGRFSVTWLDGTKEEGELPAWLTEELLIGELPAQQTPPPPVSAAAPQPPEPSPESPPVEEELNLWDAARERLKQQWSLPAAARESSPPPFAPSDMERTLALVNALKLLLKFGRLDESKQVREMVEKAPDRALWLALKSLSLGVTAASRDVFELGAGGRPFIEKGKPWYESLERQFGVIKE